MDNESQWIDRRMALAQEWDDLVEQVRRLPGFADFLRPPKVELLLEAAVDGPVVVLNVSRWRCDALIVTTTGIEEVRLADLTAEEVAENTRRYLDALLGAKTDEEPASFAQAVATYQAGRDRREETLHEITEWLWDQIAEPVLNRLGPLDRLWWCPTGLLALLPVHGAGYHRPADRGSGRSVVDRVVSSYTPTLRVLHELRSERAAAGAPKLMFVGVGDVLDLPRLHAVRQELDLLTDLFGAGLDRYEEDDGTVDAVLDALGGYRWVHFSCHGLQDLGDPSRAGFVLRDGVATVRQISDRQYAGEFAFLSACRTAIGGLHLPDEVITLAAALNYTGFRRVVGTLWSVDQTVAADVTRSVYAALTAGGTFDPARSAYALHDAVLEVRTDPDRSLIDWLPFVHSGI